MTFTALHRAVGAEPGPITDELLNLAVSAGVEEGVALDWKKKLPEKSKLKSSDYPKDIAAMANAGGGVVVFGVAEEQKAATGRTDVGDVDENYERSMHAVAITAITPPVFGIKIHKVGSEPQRAIVVEVPASVDGPHLIYRDEYFGAPIRNDADTVWMKERQLEAMYRARFDERRNATEALDRLYEDAALGRTPGTTWLVAIAHPRVPTPHIGMSREEAKAIFEAAEPIALSYADRNGVHPLESVDRLNPRPGLRRWIAPNTATGDRAKWKEAWASIHHNASVTLTASLGGHPFGRTPEGRLMHQPGATIETAGLECAVADFMAIVRATASACGTSEYEIRVGLELEANHPITILTVDTVGRPFDGVSIPIHRFTPVELSVDAAGSDDDFAARVFELARDCANQGGISNLQKISEPAPAPI
ncbi:putative DNA binding domain-containing protein (plasmid) [Rhodococcus ruber]|uniref:RNA-binding domain-containing protein n=1 Tax=Rhodococcus ruber TaxID=1830 RepID=UPI002659C940|nr:RNA-binding domain-containing protein [Rhodococcus ruber]WKK14839.1 putative DNA binding domain-containing protein [Rhodococcus ruber]